MSNANENARKQEVNKDLSRTILADGTLELGIDYV